jgi:putative peptidoglycan lipid II flippase
MSKSLFKSTSSVAAMTLISRVFGFVRDMVTAHLFGASLFSDAFFVAFRIPNFMRRLFAEGSFSQAFVPVLSEFQKNKTPEEIKSFINSMAGTLGAVLLMVTCFGILGAPVIIKVFTPGFKIGSERFDLAVMMLRITFPYLFLISMTAFSGAILNTYSRFWVPAFTPVFLNICMIATALLLAPHLRIPIVALAWGVFLAGFVQLLFQIPFLKKMGLLPKPKIDFKNAGVTKVLKLMVPALFGVSVSQVNLLLDTLFASFLMVGSVSWLYFSDRLMEFPLGIFGVAISTVILPHLSRHHATDAHEDFSLTLDWALRCVLLVGLPAAVVFAVMSGPLMSTLLQYGHFDAHAVMMARQSLSAFAIGIAPFMIIKILASGFYAKQDMRTPVRIGILAMVSNMIFNVILIWPLKHAGIALATSLAAVLNMGLLYYFLRQRGIYHPRAGWKFFSFRLFFANTLLGVWLWFGTGDIQEWVTHRGSWRMLHLSVLLVSAVMVYFLGLWIAGVRPRHILIPQQQVLSS